MSKGYIVVWYDDDYIEVEEESFIEDPLHLPYRLDCAVLDKHAIDWKYLQFKAYNGTTTEWKRQEWTGHVCTEDSMIPLRCGLSVQVRELKDLTIEAVKSEVEYQDRRMRNAQQRYQLVYNTLQTLKK